MSAQRSPASHKSPHAQSSSFRSPNTIQSPGSAGAKSPMLARKSNSVGSGGRGDPGAAQELNRSKSFNHRLLEQSRSPIRGVTFSKVSAAHAVEGYEPRVHLGVAKFTTKDRTPAVRDAELVVRGTKSLTQEEHDGLQLLIANFLKIPAAKVSITVSRPAVNNYKPRAVPEPIVPPASGPLSDSSSGSLGSVLGSLLAFVGGKDEVNELPMGQEVRL